MKHIAVLFVAMTLALAAGAQCNDFPAWIHAPRVGDTIYVSWAPVPTAQFYYVYVKENSAPGWMIYITPLTNIAALSPGTHYTVSVRPNCMSQRSCCENRKR